MGIFRAFLALIRMLFATRAALAAENLALRHQLVVLQQSVKRPKLRPRDRIFWVWLSKLWGGWRSCLLLVQPATVLRWHRDGFKRYWRRLSGRNKPGRPKIPAEIRHLIRRMCRENVLWGAPRILSELRLLGYWVAERTVAKYMIRHRKPPSQTWRTFLENHASDIAAVDFFTVPTVTFRVLYCFLVLLHDRRQVVHFNVTAHPTAQWIAQQVVEAFPWDTAPRYMIRDRDMIFDTWFRERVKQIGMKEVIIGRRAPWQNPYLERLIGSIRRECLDHVIIMNEAHLQRMLTLYLDYYHNSRPHLSLGRNAPVPRQVEPPEKGKVIATPQVGGLHHRYIRVA